MKFLFYLSFSLFSNLRLTSFVNIFEVTLRRMIARNLNLYSSNIYIFYLFKKYFFLIYFLLKIYREFYYQQIDKYARQELSNGRINAEDIHVPTDSELLKVLNVHYNRQNHISVSIRFNFVFLSLNLKFLNLQFKIQDFLN